MTYTRVPDYGKPPVIKKKRRVEKMYQLGQWIVYGKTGVCKVCEIKTIDSPRSGAEELYYVLRPLAKDCLISTPVANDRVFTRPVISRSEAERLIDTIPSLQAQPYYGRNSQDLMDYYGTYLASHDCGELIRLAMSLYAKKNHGSEDKSKFGQVDQRYMKQAEELLFGELSVALGIPSESVQQYILTRLEGHVA